MGRVKLYNREDKLEQAMRLFWQKGYYSITTNYLIKELKMGKKTFYDEFKGKNELYEEVLEKYREMGYEILKTYFVPDASLDELEKAIRSILKITTFDDTVKSCMMSNTSLELGLNDERIYGILKTHMEKVHEGFEMLIENAKVKGELDSTLNSKVLANIINSMLTGTGILARSGVDINTINESISLLFEIIRKYRV